MSRSSARATSPDRERGRRVEDASPVTYTQRINLDNEEYTIDDLLDQVENKYGGKLRENRERAVRRMTEALDDFISSPTLERSRRGTNGYLLFLKENKDTVKRMWADQGLTPGFADLSSALTNMWKNLSSEEKDEYRRRASML
jgi:hypothetical protein